MLDKILVAGYTVQDALLAVSIVTGFLILFSMLKKIFRKEKINQYMQFAICEGCGWQGQVSRHAGLCPGCNQPLGDRMASRRPRKGAKIMGNESTT
jgi:hypothetical protein